MKTCFALITMTGIPLITRKPMTDISVIIRKPELARVRTELCGKPQVLTWCITDCDIIDDIISWSINRRERLFQNDHYGWLSRTKDIKVYFSQLQSSRRSITAESSVAMQQPLSSQQHSASLSSVQSALFALRSGQRLRETGEASSRQPQQRQSLSQRSQLRESTACTKSSQLFAARGVEDDDDFLC